MKRTTVRSPFVLPIFSLEFELSSLAISYSSRTSTVGNHFNLKEFGVSPNDSSRTWQCVKFGGGALSYDARDKEIDSKSRRSKTRKP